MANRLTAVPFWLADRLTDLALWPINLVRDGPARVGRLRRTAADGLRAANVLLPNVRQAYRQRTLRGWARQEAGQLAAGLHRFVAQLFDLAGGPEVAQCFIRLTTRATPLTRAEMTMITAVLGPHALRLGEVRVAEGGLLDLVFRYNGNLAFAAWRTICLPRHGRHTRAARPILVHELTHVYQYEKVGSRYLGEAIYVLIKTRRDCYNYGGGVGLGQAWAEGRCYRDYNREQQAKITQDYYFLREEGSDVAAYEPFMAQVRAGEL